MDFFRRIFRSKKRRPAKLDDPFYHRNTSYLDPPLPPRYRDLHRPSSAPTSPFSPHSFHNHGGPSPAAFLPDAILACIFAFVCPHSTDTSLLPAEDTTTPSGCMLCDMRDLSFCAGVCQSWHRAALRAQYTSIRLDSVHYCGLEDALERRRKRGSVFQKKEDAPQSIPEARMRLLYRTFAANEQAALAVRSLKLPYMTRETCKADLARLLSLTPGLRYVDLPEGVWSDDASCAGIRSILLARCSDLRRMCWAAGSELSFASEEAAWVLLEVVELRGLRVEDADIARVLAGLPMLRDLTLASLPWISLGVFHQLPALAALHLLHLPLTIATPDLAHHAASLTALTLEHSATPDELPAILAALPLLRTLTFRAHLARPSPTAPAPLSHAALRRMKYELTSPRQHGYYSTLSTSLPGLPALREVYVRDAGFHARVPAKGVPAGLAVFEKAGEHSLEWERYEVLWGGGEVRRTTEAAATATEDLLLFVPPSAPFLGAEGGTGRRGSFSSLRSERGDLWR